jgi:hypothetical protein
LSDTTKISKYFFDAIKVQQLDDFYKSSEKFLLYKDSLRFATIKKPLFETEEASNQFNQSVFKFNFFSIHLNQSLKEEETIFKKSVLLFSEEMKKIKEDFFKERKKI